MNPNARHQKEVKRTLKDACPGMLFFTGTPVRVEVGFYFPRPKHHFKKGFVTRCKEALTYFGFLQTTPATGPDIDNLAKFVLDAMNGIVYEDDRQVVELLASKHKDSNDTMDGRTVIKVKRYDDRYPVDSYGNLLQQTTIIILEMASVDATITITEYCLA